MRGVIVRLFLAVLAPAFAWASLPPEPTLQVDDAQRLTIEQLTSIFENSTTEFQYAYVEDIGDGAGITCGRVGFTGKELELLVKRYAAAKGSAPIALARWLPCLQKEGDHIMQDYSCLYPDFHGELRTRAFKREGGFIAQFGFGKDWVEAARDPIMRKVQDDYAYATYYLPAYRATKKAGLHTPLALALTYDTNIQMDSMNELIRFARTKFLAAHPAGQKTYPITEAEELEWLGYYQAQRKFLLTRGVVGEGTGPRVDSLDQILKAGNTSLKTPFSITYFGQPFTLTGR